MRTLAALLWMLLWQPLAPQAQAAPSAAPAPTTAPARTAAASGGGAAAAPAAGAAAAPSGASAASTAPDSAPVPLASVPAASEAVNAEILKVQNTLDADETEQRIRTALSEAVSDVDTRLDETSRVTEDSPDLPDLRELAGGWQKTRDSLGGWQQDLTDQAARLEKDAQRLQSLAAQWDATLEAARAATGTPQDVVQRIERTGEALRKEHDAVEKRRAALLSLLDQVATQLGRSSQALSEIDRASKRIVDEVFLRQNAPIWRAHGGTATAEAAQGNQSFAARLRALADYADRAQEMIALHAVVVIVLAAALMLIRRRVRAWANKVPALGATVPVFQLPVASALVLSALGSHWFYVDAPRLFWSAVGAIALLATVAILRHIGDRRIIPVLYAVLAAYVVDQLRHLLPGANVLARDMFLAEMFAGAVFCYAYVRRLLQPNRRPEGPGVQRSGVGAGVAGTAAGNAGAAGAAGGGAVAGASGATAAGAAHDVPQRVFFRWTYAVAVVAALLFALAFVTHALGFTSLGYLLAGTALGSAYTGVILYAAVLILDALVLLALHAWPLRYSRLVQLHTEPVWTRVRRFIRWVAALWWAVMALDRLNVRSPLVTAAGTLLHTGVKAGSLDITIGDLLSFGITLWLAFLAARVVNFVLEEDVFPRSSLPRGLPYAISTTARYAILAVGFLAAVAALGVDMTKFTILVGALTVGIGFGLQNIVNNFVSGLILLFERPVKVGDVIQIGDTIGTVRRIGIRATVVDTAIGAHIIVPNGQFISANVTNLTGLSSYRPAQLSVAVVSGSDVRRVLELLPHAALACSGVLKEPAPRALLSKLGPDALLFDLRVWTDQGEDWPRIINDVASAVSETLRQAGVAIK